MGIKKVLFNGKYILEYILVEAKEGMLMNGGGCNVQSFRLSNESLYATII